MTAYNNDLRNFDAEALELLLLNLGNLYKESWHIDEMKNGSANDGFLVSTINLYLMVMVFGLTIISIFLLKKINY